MVGKNLVDRTGSEFPAWARDHAANSGRAIYGRILDYGVKYGGSSGYRPATHRARSSYGRR